MNMYESYTRQSLGSKEYRELLGTAQMVFNANNAFIIENILRYDTNSFYNWSNLMDLTSGGLRKPIKETITKVSNTRIARLFEKIIYLRNRLFHSYQITDKDVEQRLATKEENGNRFVIDEWILQNSWQLRANILMMVGYVRVASHKKD